SYGEAEEGTGVVPGDGDDRVLVDQELAAGFSVLEDCTTCAGEGFGRASVEEISAAGHFAGEAASGEDIDELFQAALVLGADLAGDGVVVECGGGGFLDGDELATVAVVFHVGKRADDQRMAADPAEAPADHVEAFGHRVDFDTDFFGAGHAQETV